LVEEAVEGERSGVDGVLVAAAAASTMTVRVLVAARPF
jgi:hypothetical protein